MNSLPTTPDLAQILESKTLEIFSRLHCHHLGQIESFDAATQTATISLAEQLNFAGETKTFPLLEKVPVFVLGGGDRVITLPIKKGDTCLVLFNDRDIDVWTQTGATAAPSSDRQHDIADGLALVGFRSKANSVASYSTSDVEIRNGQAKISVGPKILIANPTTDMLTVLQLAVTALTKLNAVKSGGDATAEIVAFQTQLSSLLKSS